MFVISKLCLTFLTLSPAAYRDATKCAHRADHIVSVIVGIGCVNMTVVRNAPKAPLDFVSPMEEDADALFPDATKVQETNSFVQRKFPS